MNKGVELRSYVVIDRMQPQYAAFLGTVSKGDIPLPGMSQLFLEIAPGSEIYGMMDIALKNGNAKPGFQEVEREFGMMELHSYAVDDVIMAGNQILESYNLSEDDILKPSLVSDKIIESVDPYQAQLINRFRQGSALVPKEALLILEVEPAVYVTAITNQIEKDADIKLVHFDPVGKYGRIYVAGNESQVRTAKNVSIQMIESYQRKS